MIVKKIIFLAFCFSSLFIKGAIAEVHYSVPHQMDSLLNELKRFDTDKQESIRDTSKSLLLYEISKLYWGGIPETGINYANQCLSLSKRIGYKRGIALGYNSLGAIYFGKGDYQKALENIENSRKIRIELKDKVDISASNNNIGLIYFAQGNYPAALASYFVSLKLSEEAGDKQGIARSYNNIGRIYSAQGNYAEALKNQINALSLRKELGLKSSIAESYKNIGMICLEQRNYPDALSNLKAALILYQQIGEKEGCAETYFCLGSNFEKQCNYPEAMNNFKIALNSYEEIAHRKGMAISFLHLGIIYKLLHQNKEAIQYSACGLEIAKEIGAKDIMKDAYGNLSEIYAGLKDYKAAYDFHLLFKQINDSIFNTDNQSKLTELKMNYEFEKKDAVTQAEIQKQKIIKNEIIGIAGLLIVFTGISFIFYKRRREAEMQAGLAESRLSAINSQLDQHFIFSSLSSIRSYMGTNVDQASDYLVRFAKYVRSVLQHSDELEIPLKKELEELENYLVLEQLRFSNKFSFKFNIEPGLQTEIIMVPPLLMQPIVENSIVHGFSGINYEGTISVDVYQEGNNLVFKISDNGKGMKEKKTEITGHRKSFGMKLTQERIEIYNRMHKQNAVFKVEELQQGISVTFYLPLLV